MLSTPTSRAEKPSWVYDPTLALWLPLWLKDASSFMARDQYGHLATKGGVPIWTTQGFYFDGIDDYLSLGSPGAIPLSANSFSVACIFRVDAIGLRSGLIVRDSAVAFSWLLHVENTNVVRFRIGNTAAGDYVATSTGRTVLANNYYMVLATWDFANLTARIYLNGNLEASSSTTTGTRQTASYDLQIGRTMVLETYTAGTISACFLWNNRIIYQPEAMSLYLEARRQLPWL